MSYIHDSSGYNSIIISAENFLESFTKILIFSIFTWFYLTIYVINT